LRAINHALTGTIIGLTVREPAIALPLAVVSHFICDIIPHYSSDLPVKKWLKSQLFKNLLYADALLCFALVLLLASRHPLHWQLAAVCAFLAAAPDFLWLPRFISANSKRAWRATPFDKFAEKIQWFQRPIGVVVEAVWFFAAIILLAPFVK